MKKFWITLAACFGLASTAEVMACTGLLVGKKASVDGSVMISYAADSYTLYGELYHWPAAVWPEGAMLDITEWDTGKPLGQIPQVRQTYSVVGNMNEHQVAITESTFGGRPELVDTTGIMDYGSLIYVALQRSKSAREAIQVMTDLVAKYGYYSGGESFSIADKNEAWIMEMVGKGTGNKGAVWVAIRIPDDCIAAHANQSRIQQIPFDDKENCMYSPDVVSFAREKGARVWSFFNKYNKDMGKYLGFAKGDVNAEPMPLYIKPDRKLSVADVRDMMRDHYEGTELDMTNDPGAGPYKAPYRFRPLTYKVDGETYTNERPISTQQSGFVIVPQLRSWLPDAIGGVLWFAVDDANTTVFTPIYCSSTDVPECYRQGNGSMMQFSWTSAFWIRNWVANMVYGRYNQMIGDLRKVQSELENGYLDMQPAIDKAASELYQKDPKEAAKFLTWYSTTTADESVDRWKKLGEFLIVKYSDGVARKEKDGRFLDNGYGLGAAPDSPGYSEDFYRAIVKSAGERLKVK